MDPLSDHAAVEQANGAIDLFITAAVAGGAAKNFAARLVPLGDATALVLTDVAAADGALIAGPDALARLAHWLQRELAD